MTEPREILVIGLGNDYRGDDAVGHVVARKLKTIRADNIRVLEESGEGAALIEAWKGANFVILIDAVHSGGLAGSVYRFDAKSQPIPTGYFQYSTHAVSVAEAVELARVLDQLPAKLIVYGIEGKTFDSGVGLSHEVQEAVEELVHRLKEELCRLAKLIGNHHDRTGCVKHEATIVVVMDEVTKPAQIAFRYDKKIC